MTVKTNVLYFICWVGLYISTIHASAFAQSRYDTSLVDIAGRCPESVVVFTDRSIYAVNESIRFSAMLSSWLESYPGGGSEILYVELLSPEGKAIAKGKYPIRFCRTAGSLSIPVNIYTGIYYLRCYTRWMRNFSTAEFAYIPLKVVNPFSNEVEIIEHMPTGNILEQDPVGRKAISVHLPRETSDRGEVVRAEIGFLPGDTAGVKYGCVTVVPWGAMDTSLLQYRVHSEDSDPKPFKFEFLPELNGVVLSGEIYDQAGEEQVAGSRIHFSFVDGEPAYFVTQADRHGRFSLRTPAYAGTRELYIVAESATGRPVEFRLDSDYAPEGLPFVPEPFILQIEQYKLASRVSFQMQLNRAYLERNQTEGSATVQERNPGPVFGGDRISIRLDEFIQLPNLEEVIQNLLPDTYITGRTGHKRLLIKGDDPMISLYPHLLMVDHLPVLDVNLFLSISPLKIDRIDLVPEVYVKGEDKFGGMISIATREGDFGGIQLPEESSFFDFEYVRKPLPPLEPGIGGPGNIPDTRNTLFWMDRIKFDADSTFTFEFSAAHIPGPYLVLFRGITSDGAWVYGWNRLLVH